MIDHFSRKAYGKTGLPPDATGIVIDLPEPG